MKLLSSLSTAQLIVRNLDDDLVKRLKRSAAANGRSAEEEHRHLLRQALRPEGFAETLRSMPNVGDDADFGRIQQLPRCVSV